MNRVVRRSLLPVVLGLLLGAVFAFALGRVLDSALKEKTRRDLVDKLERLSAEFEPDLKARDHPHERVRSAARLAGARLTLIAADGAVLADSQVSPEELPLVENHGSRPEVLAARQGETGFGQRRSVTVHEPFVYVARRVGPPEAPAGYVRLAISQAQLDAVEDPFRQTLLDVSVAVGLLVAILVGFIRHRHARELDRVRDGVAAASEGRAPAPLPHRSSDESEEVFVALSRFARLVAAEREGSERARLLARTVFMEVPVGLVVVDGTLAVLDANPAAIHLFRASSTSAPHALVDLVRDPEVLRLFENGTAGAPDALPDSLTVRIGGDLTSERILEFTVRAVPHAGRSGVPAAVGVVRDVTERERNETMRRRFVSDVSHELRTPIAAIRAAVETLGAEENLPEDLARLVAIIQRQSAEMADLVSDLTDLSQIESGSVLLQTESLALLPLLSAVAKDLAPAAEARGVAVALDVPVALAVRGDRRRLSQVFRNLLDNAIKFSPPGARIDVLAEVARSSGSSARSVAVHVIDRGIGIPRSEQSRIFQRFYRVDPSRAKSVPGTGLGLAIVKHLLILHGGAIRLDSEPGKGSRFTVSLPSAAAVPQALQSQEKP